ATVLDAQDNGRRSLERLQLAQVRQLAGTIDSAVAAGFATEAQTVGRPPPWNLTPNDPADAARLARLQSPVQTTGSILIDRSGVITNGTLLQGAKVGDRLRRPELERALGDNAAPAVLPVAPGVTTSLSTIALAYPVKDASGLPAGAYVTETDVSGESTFNQVIKPLGRGRTGAFSFLDDRGTI